MTESGSDAVMTVEVRPDGVVVVHGDIDIAGGPLLDAALEGLEPRGPIVIDLADVSFIDSSGLRSLLSASRLAKARDVTVVLRYVGPEVARLLQITGTADLFVVES